MNLAKGWSADLANAPRRKSIILACTYADQDDAWFRGEAVFENDEWFWISGVRVSPKFTPRAWIDIPWPVAD